MSRGCVALIMGLKDSMRKVQGFAAVSKKLNWSATILDVPGLETRLLDV